MNIKDLYVKHIKRKTLYYRPMEMALRLIMHYTNIANIKFNSTILDIGSGDMSFEAACCSHDYRCYSLDYPSYDAEYDIIPYEDNVFDVVTLNAVIEHISDPSIMMMEIKRVLKKGGKLIVRTPNFSVDYKNFYNDVTHVKPYTPKSLEMLLNIYKFKVDFCEPGLILKNKLWYKVPFKWTVAKYLTGSTKSVIIIGINEK